MSREYVSKEFNCQWISVIVHGSAERPDKLAWFTCLIYWTESYCPQVLQVAYTHLYAPYTFIHT